MSENFLISGHSKYSLLGWSDGGITAMILAAAHPKSIHHLVVWGANATVTAKDIELYEVIRDTSKWSLKMREPLEGETSLMNTMWIFLKHALERFVCEQFYFSELLKVFCLFSHFVCTLIIKISSSEEPTNSMSIHRFRNSGKLSILFHPSSKIITEMW